MIQKWNLDGLSVSQNGNNLKDLARWDFPPQDWCKINLDVALKGNPTMAGYGFIIRNTIGDSMGVMAIPIGEQMNHGMEVSTTLYGLDHAKSMNLDNIWIEGDSLNIINHLNKVSDPSWIIHYIICKAIFLISSF